MRDAIDVLRTWITKMPAVIATGIPATGTIASRPMARLSQSRPTRCRRDPGLSHGVLGQGRVGEYAHPLKHLIEVLREAIIEAVFAPPSRPPLLSQGRVAVERLTQRLKRDLAKLGHPPDSRSQLIAIDIVPIREEIDVGEVTPTGVCHASLQRRHQLLR